MGYAVPGALGARLAHPDRPIVAFTGDGGFLMAVAELQTAQREKLPIIVVVFDDQEIGLIRVKQEIKGIPLHGVEARRRRLGEARRRRSAPTASWSRPSRPWATRWARRVKSGRTDRDRRAHRPRRATSPSSTRCGSCDVIIVLLAQPAPRTARALPPPTLRQPQVAAGTSVGRMGAAAAKPSGGRRVSK